MNRGRHMNKTAVCNMIVFNLLDLKKNQFNRGYMPHDTKLYLKILVLSIRSDQIKSSWPGK